MGADLRAVDGEGGTSEQNWGYTYGIPAGGGGGQSPRKLENFVEEGGAQAPRVRLQLNP